MIEGVPAGLRPVTEAAESARQQDLVAPALDRPAHLDGDFLARHGWTAVPVESGCHFCDGDVELLAAAMRRIGVTEVLATAGEDLLDFPLCLTLPATEEGLLGFDEFTGHLNFALSDPGMRFVVLCTVYDYYLVAGPPEFVGHAVGGDIPTARRIFEEFADGHDRHEPGRLSGRLRAVARRYAP